MRRSGAYLLLILTLLAAPLAAQDEEKDFITRTIEGALAGDNLAVQITGLTGALSARASAERIQVSDKDGPWLVIEGAVFDWTRSALLRGRLEVQELSARHIHVMRQPGPSPGADDLPTPEATPFALPDLPVAVDIGAVRAERVTLDEAVAGIPAELSLNGRVRLDDGTLDTSLAVVRLDRPTDKLDLTLAFGNATRNLTIDIALIETQDGLVGTTLSIPGAPPLSLTLKGDGPLDAFTAELAVATEGVNRFGGRVSLRGQDGGTGFTADMQGDLTPLLAAPYHPFFGANTRARLNGVQAASGAISIPSLLLETDSLDLTGQLALAANGRLDALGLTGRIAAANGAPSVRLPVGEPPTTITSADIELDFEPANGVWSLRTEVEDFARPDMSVGRLVLTGAGQLVQDVTTQLFGQIDLSAEAVGFSDTNLASAIGPELSLSGGFGWRDEGLRFDGLRLDGAGLQMVLSGLLSGLESGLEFDGALSLETTDIARFSGLAGRDLGGALTANITGQAAPLSGTFDLALTGEGTDLHAGVAQLDPLLKGTTRLDVAARRDEAGLALPRFLLANPALNAEGNATLNSTGGLVDFTARLAEVTGLVPTLEGPLALEVAASGADGLWNGEALATLIEPNPATIRLDGTYDLAGAAELDFDLGFERLERFVDALPGSVTAQGRLTRAGSLWNVTTEAGGTAGISGQFDAQFVDTSGRLTSSFEAGFDKLGRFVPQLAGTLALTGQAERQDGAWRVSTQTGGSAGLSGRIAARFDEATQALEVDYDAALAQVERLIAALPGDVKAQGTLRRDGSAWQVSTRTGGSLGLEGQIDATLVQDTGAISSTFDLSFDKLARFVPQLAGTLELKGDLNRQDGIWQATTQSAGSAGVYGQFAARFIEATQALALDYDATLDRLERFVAALPGTVTAKGELVRAAGRWEIETDAGGTAGLGGVVSASFDEETGAIQSTFDARFERLQQFVPQLAGSVSLTGDATREGETWQVTTRTSGSAGISGRLSAQFVESTQALALDYDAALERLERFSAGLAGTLRAEGTAAGDGPVWAVDTTLTGPGALQAKLDGSFDAASNRADLSIGGQARLELANATLSPNSIQGPIRFDLALNGPPALGSLSGRIVVDDSRLALPELGQTVNGINAAVSLSGGEAQISVSARAGNGGTLAAVGPVSLNAPYRADLGITIDQLVLTNSLNFHSTTSGALSLSGPLLTAPRLSGNLRFGETEIDLNAASSSLSFPAIPEMRHLGEPADSRRTRARAGLLKAASSGSGPVVALDLLLDAPGRIFARGRGLQAELGGAIRVTGTSTAPSASGEIGLIRGTFDILGRRLQLDEGRITLLGQLSPYLYFRASTSTTQGEAVLEIEGPVTEPRIEVSAIPERPSEEALALLVFGDAFDDISPLGIAQLASQVSTLSGRGGGFVSNLRSRLGVDTLDLGTDDDGSARVGVGAYLGENVYSNVTVNAEGKSEVSLNLDLTDTLSIKGRATNDGDTGIGLYFEKDY